MRRRSLFYHRGHRRRPELSRRRTQRNNQ